MLMQEWERSKYSILDAWAWRCAAPQCWRKTSFVHEITSRGAGGKVEWGNSIPLCYAHHQQAHAGLISEAALRKWLRRR